MELARHPYVTAGVALAAASMIAVTPVAPPPLPDVQVPAVQLTAATDLLGDVPGILGGLESAVAADLGSAGSLGSIGGLLDPLAGLVGASSILGDPESFIQQLIILFGIDLVRNAINDVTLVAGVTINVLFFEPLETVLNTIGGLISSQPGARADRHHL